MSRLPGPGRAAGSTGYPPFHLFQMQTNLHFSRRCFGWLTALLLLAAGNAWAMSPFRDYTLAPRQETYVPVSGGTAVAAVQTNDGVSGAIPLGFDFKFDGSSYNTVYASSNGFLSFNSAILPAPNNDL